MKDANPPRRITPAHFRERARNYRLAEAIADAPRDVEMFHDLTTMFERLPEDFARMAHGPKCVSRGRCTGSCGQPT